MNAERRPSPPQKLARRRWLSATQLWLSNKQLTPPTVTTSTVLEAGVPGTRVLRAVCAISFNPPSDPVRWGLVIALFLKEANGGPEKFKVMQQKQGLNPDSGDLAPESIQSSPRLLRKRVGNQI